MHKLLLSIYRSGTIPRCLLQHHVGVKSLSYLTSQCLTHRNRNRSRNRNRNRSRSRESACNSLSTKYIAFLQFSSSSQAEADNCNTTAAEFELNNDFKEAFNFYNGALGCFQRQTIKDYRQTSECQTNDLFVSNSVL